MKRDLPERPKLKCSQCKGEYDAEAGFNLNAPERLMHRSLRRSRCVGCQQTTRDAKKHGDPCSVKARDTLRRHAARLKPDLSMAEFARRYDWDIQRIAHDFRHAYENTCGYCWRPYAEMAGGLWNVTLDIRDRSLEPYYRTNTQTCCNTCNREKSTMTPEQWARRLQFWVQWKEQQEKNKKSPPPTEPEIIQFDVFGEPMTGDALARKTARNSKPYFR
jgi:hypothetical protein